MASVNWKKCSGGTQAKALLRHHCKDTRQATENHSNKELDKRMTRLNYGSREGKTYADACARYDARVAEVLSYGNTDKRSKVTMFCLEAPTPKDLPAEKQRAWFGRVRDIAVDQLGRENFIGLWVHVDEVHDYKDAVTGLDATSRVHCHMGFVAGVGEGNEARLCGKDFSSLKNINKLNDTIEQMSMDEFGVHFMDGSKRKSKAKVGDLKRRSKAKAEELEELKEKLELKEAALNERERALDAREASLQERERAVEAAEAAPAKPAAAETGRKSVSLNEVKKRTRSQLNALDYGYGQGIEKGR